MAARIPYLLVLSLLAFLPALAKAAPVANPDSYTLPPNTGVVVDSGVLDNDVRDGAELQAALVSGPSNGELTLFPDGTFEYVPNPGFTGSDSFSYAARERPGPILFTLTPESSVDIAVDLMTANGDASDSATSPLSGTIEAVFDSGSAPFSLAQVIELDGTLDDEVRLTFPLSPLGGIEALLPAGEFTISMLTPGPAAAVDADGFFTQVENEMQTSGTASLSGTGLLVLVFPPTEQDLANTAVADLQDVRITETGGLLRLESVLAIAGVVPLDEVTAIGVDVSGAMIATAPAPMLEMSNTVVVTLQVSDADGDGDLMPDAWESLFGLNLAVNDAALDRDCDGARNLDEYIVGTRPNDPFSVWRVKSVSTAAGQTRFEFDTCRGRVYRLLRSADGVNWLPEKKAQVVGGGAVEMLTGPLNGATRVFWQIEARLGN